MSARAITEALTTKEAREVAGRFLAAVERVDNGGSVEGLKADLRSAAELAERYAGVTTSTSR